MRLGTFVALLILGFSMGCNQEPPPVTVTPAPSPVKGMLEEIANTGQMTSGMMDIETALNQMKSSDPAKAEKLLQEYDELKSTKTPEETKAKAKAMADQL